MNNTSATELADQLNISKARGLEAVMKARLIAAVLKEAERRHLTHAQLAEASGLSRSAVTGRRQTRATVCNSPSSPATSLST